MACSFLGLFCIAFPPLELLVNLGGFSVPLWGGCPQTQRCTQHGSMSEDSEREYLDDSEFLKPIRLVRIRISTQRCYHSLCRFLFA